MLLEPSCIYPFNLSYFEIIMFEFFVIKHFV